MRHHQCPLANDERYVSTNIAFCKGASAVAASRCGIFPADWVSPALEDGEVFQHRDDADHDHDDTHDVLRAAVEWQHVHEIENENDDQKRDQDTDQDVHTWLLASLPKGAGQLTRKDPMESSNALRPVLTGQSEKSSTGSDAPG
jgi:hypothetical protein